MIFKDFDFLSPSITLYFKGNSIHPTRFSGILTIVTFIIISAFGIYYAVEYVTKGDKKTLNLFIFTCFKEVIKIQNINIKIKIKKAIFFQIKKLNKKKVFHYF